VEKNEDEKKVGRKPMQTPQIPPPPDRFFQKQDGLKRPFRRRLVVEKEQQAGGDKQ